MKKIFCILSIAFGLSIPIQSCKKSSANEPVTNIITATIKANQQYQYNLGGFGYEEGAGIIKQATHFLTSVALRDSASVDVIYTYIPATGYVGTDEVELKSARGSNGASANDKIIYTIIKFTITN